jgi:hypothetical protein
MNNKFTIYESPVYFGSYIVVNNETGERTDCHNLATARAIITERITTNDSNNEQPRQLTLEEYYGCATGGLGYTPAVTWVLTGRTEQVHNWGTAKSIARSFPLKQWSE